MRRSRPALMGLMGLVAACSARPLDLPDPAGGLGPTPDLGAVADLAAPDLAAPVDFAAARDLARPAPADLASPVMCAVDPCAVEVSVDGYRRDVGSSPASYCARLSDGTVRCWGSNESGQLAAGTITVSGNKVTAQPMMLTTPTTVPGIAQASGIAMAGAPYHAFACAIAGPTRQVRCWGDNDVGELAQGGATVYAVVASLPIGPYATTPLPVALEDVDQIALGSGNVYGFNSFNRGCALSDGTVQCWGASDGNMVPSSIGGSGYPVYYRPTPFAVPLPRAVRQLAVGAGTEDCALLDDGEVDCWGANEDCILGPQSTINSSGPVAIEIPPARSVSINERGACAVTRAGSVLCWGMSYVGTPGLDAGTVVPGTAVEVPLPSGWHAASVVSVFAGACVLLTDGHVACWPTTTSAPALITGVDDAVQLSGNGSDACVVERTGQVACWFCNEQCTAAMPIKL